MNWKNLLAEILADGWTQEAIATFVGCRQSTISDLATGRAKTTNHEYGKKLEALHSKVMRKRRRKIAEHSAVAA